MRSQAAARRGPTAGQRVRPRALRLVAAVGVALVLPLAATACGSGTTSGAPTQDPAALSGKVWKAVEIAGVATPAADAEVTATFEDGVVGGSGGVNRYSAGYSTGEPDGITIEQPAATLMAGPEDAMAQEGAYFTALTEAASFAVAADTLTLMDAKGATLVRYEAVVPASLEKTTWRALAYNNGKGALEGVADGTSVTAVFGEDASLSGNASVNQYSTTYTTSGETMSIDGAIVTTKMAGPQKAMDQEAAYLAALPRTATYLIEGDELWLRDADGAALAHYRAE